MAKYDPQISLSYNNLSEFDEAFICRRFFNNQQESFTKGMPSLLLCCCTIVKSSCIYFLIENLWHLRLSQFLITKSLMINTFSRFRPQKFSSLNIYMHAWMDGIYIYTYIKKIKKKEIHFLHYCIT